HQLVTTVAGRLERPLSHSSTHLVHRHCGERLLVGVDPDHHHANPPTRRLHGVSEDMPQSRQIRLLSNHSDQDPTGRTSRRTATTAGGAPKKRANPPGQPSILIDPKKADAAFKISL